MCKNERSPTARNAPEPVVTLVSIVIVVTPSPTLTKQRSAAPTAADDVRHPAALIAACTLTTPSHATPGAARRAVAIRRTSALAAPYSLHATGRPILAGDPPRLSAVVAPAALLLVTIAGSLPIATLVSSTVSLAVDSSPHLASVLIASPAVVLVAAALSPADTPSRPTGFPSPPHSHSDPDALGGPPQLRCSIHIRHAVYAVGPSPHLRRNGGLPTPQEYQGGSRLA